MATAGEIITRALRGIGAIDAIETPSAEDMSAGLLALNDLVEAYSIKRGSIYAQATETFTLTPGDGSYTIGSAGDIATARPLRIESAFLRYGAIDYPLEIIASRDQYNAIEYKSVGGLPARLYYDPTFSSGTILFDRLPDKAYQLHLTSWKPFTAFASSGAVVNMPGYLSRYWRICLQIELAAEYGKPIEPVWIGQKDEMESDMRALHRRDVRSCFDIAAARDFNIQAG